MKIKQFLLVLMLAVVVGVSGGLASAVATPFEVDVTAAIDDGLDYLRTANAFTSGGTNERKARGLVLLALLEKRPSFGAAPNGYNGSSPADKVLAESAVVLIMNDTSYGVRKASFYAYTEGENMMALSFYARTGGPEVVNTDGYTLRSAIDRLVDRSIASILPGIPVRGGWYYSAQNTTSIARFDSSTTQFVVAGLAAAKGYYLATSDPGGRVALIDSALADTAARYDQYQNADGGEGYRIGTYNSSYAQTASSLWCSLLGGNNLNVASIQARLNWLYQNYNYQTIYAAYNSWSSSYYYYLWSSSKALTAQ